MAERERPRLKRRLGLAQAMAVALGAMIGAGVYVSMGEAAGTTGGSLLLAVLVGAAVATLNGLSSAELGAYDPRAGGAYQFGRRLVHPLVGFVAGWLFLLAALTAGATYALTFSAYLEPLVPGIPPRAAGLALIVGATALNALGVRPSARANVTLVLVNVAVLLIFAAIALPALEPGRLEPFFTGGVAGLLEASALLFFAYTGYARPVTIAEEVKEPEATLPRAVTGAIAISLALYLLVALGALGALGSERMGGDAAPLRTAMAAAESAVGPVLLSLGAVVATATVLLTEVWGLSRLAFAMARNGELPGAFGRLSSENRIPRAAVLAAGAVLLVLSATLDLRSALEVSSFSLLVYYGIMNVSALRMPRDRRLYPAFVPAAGVVANLLIALFLSWWAVATAVAAALVGLGYRSLRRRGGGS